MAEEQPPPSCRPSPANKPVVATCRVDPVVSRKGYFHRDVCKEEKQLQPSPLVETMFTNDDAGTVVVCVSSSALLAVVAVVVVCAYVAVDNANHHDGNQ